MDVGSTSFQLKIFQKKKKLKRVINLHNASVNPFFFAKTSALTSLLTKPSPCSLIWRYKTPVDVSRMARENRRQILRIYQILRKAICSSSDASVSRQTSDTPAWSSSAVLFTISSTFFYSNGSLISLSLVDSNQQHVIWKGLTRGEASIWDGVIRRESYPVRSVQKRVEFGARICLSHGALHLLSAQLGCLFLVPS